VGEIKSTLELAMEKTKKFAVSEMEKQAMKQKEVLQKATSLFHRHRDGSLSLSEIMKQIERMEEKTATTVRESLLSQWIDALSLDEGGEKTLKGIESMRQRDIDQVKLKFHSLGSRYQEEKEKVREKVKFQLLEALRNDGIDGSAVEPNLNGNELWAKENEKLDQSYKIRLEEIKEQLRGS